MDLSSLLHDAVDTAHGPTSSSTALANRSGGEVVVFDGRGEFVGDPVDKDDVKRVIGVEGDRVACCVDGRLTVG